MLLHWGALREARDSAGDTPLKMAEREGHEGVADAIVKFSRKSKQ